MITTLVTMKVAVASFPNIDGLNVRGPEARLTIAHDPHDHHVAADHEHRQPQRDVIGQWHAG